MRDAERDLGGRRRTHPDLEMRKPVFQDGSATQIWDEWKDIETGDQVKSCTMINGGQ